MAAGLGFKDFTTGEVLTAADVDGYLMQGIWVFASAAARDAAVTSPQEGNFAFTKDNNSLWYYDGAAWVASGATGDIEGVTAGIGISGGGTSGTVTITNSMATAIDAKGDLVAGTGADTFAKLTVGANDTVLTADSSTATGLKWAAVAGGGANWTLLNTGGTALTGAQTITVSGISNQSQVMFFIAGGSSANGSSLFSFRINSDSGSNYNQFGANLSWQNTYSSGNYSAISNTSQSDYYLHYGAGNAAGVFSGYVFLTGCNSSGVKSIIAGTGGTQTGNETSYTGGYWNNSASVTSVSLLSSSGNFDAGTIYVYTSA